MPSFSQTHSTTIDAAPATIHALIDDFRQWTRWSPWEGVDPDLQRTYSGAESGPGAVYDWTGNAQAGTGRMTIVSSTPEAVTVDLEFIKPFKARNTVVFALIPAGETTKVDWTMSGTRGPLMALAGKLFFDKAIGKDFDKGLASLKAEAEGSAA
jgi:hypothetical protein